jgi:FMN-dependent NADH-azoreductase
MATVLHINSSARRVGSATRELTGRLVVGLPIYNFGPPSSIKAWADLVARAGTTFRDSEAGPKGLVPDRPTYIVAASGGVPIGSPADHSSTWLTSFLGFLGITDITTVRADGLDVEPEPALDAARARVDELALPRAG